MNQSVWRTAACLLVVVGLAGGCAEKVPGVGAYSAQKDVADAHVPIKGLPSGGPTDVDRIAGNAVFDIEQYWTGEMPKVFDIKYKPVSGGIFSVDPDNGVDNVPCVNSASEIRGNAFYCPKADAVAWDRKLLLPTLKKKFGSFPIAMVLAHELGHAIQARTSEPGSKTIVVETQADCYAGAWTAAAEQGQAAHFEVDARSIDDALSGYLLFRDPVGASPEDVQAHGNAFDRVSAFQEGFEQGPKHCKTFDDSRQFTEAPFSSNDTNNGNLPFDQAMDLGSQDLAAFWKNTFQSEFGKAFTPVKAVTGYDGNSDAGRPRCDGQAVFDAVQYCAGDNTIYFDKSKVLPNVYRRSGDFGPMTLIGVGYGEAIRHQLGKSTDGEEALQNEICLAGAYAGEKTRNPASGDKGLSLSPGDLDEAVQALLTFGGTVFGDPNSAGFVRIASFRKGFAALHNCH